LHDLFKALRGEGVSVLAPHELSDDEMEWLEQHFMEQVFPVLTPLAID